MDGGLKSETPMNMRDEDRGEDRSGDGQVVDMKEVRRAMVNQRDIRNDIGFQNDINLMLSSLDQTRAPWEAAAPLFAPMKPPVPRRIEPRQESRTRRYRAVSLAAIQDAQRSSAEAR